MKKEIGNNKKRIRVLLINPHPDDGEVMGSQICVQSVKAGYETHQFLYCCDEYGTTKKEFLGKRIQKIRRYEMIQAAKAYGVDINGDSLVKLHWGDYIDIHVPFNNESVNRLKRFILKINPHIIVGADPFNHYDGHPDHVNAGLNYFFALKRIKPSQRPKLMLFYQTLKPDFFIPYRYRQIIYKARLAHKSQFSPLIVKIMDKITFLSYPIFAIKTGRLCMGYRIVKFNENNYKSKGLFKIIQYFNRTDRSIEKKRVSLNPKELGLEINPKGEID